MVWEVVRVEAYSGARGQERPLSVTWRGRRLAVSEVIDRWYQGGRSPKDPKLDYFLVRLEGEGEPVMLRYNALFDTWGLRQPPGQVGE